jgi:hypothetical protein
MTTQLKTEITGFLKVSAPETLIVAAGNLAILTIYLIGSELNSRPAVLCSRVNFPFVLGTTTHSRAGNCRTIHQTDVMLAYVSRIDTDMKLVPIIIFFVNKHLLPVNIKNIRIIAPRSYAAIYNAPGEVPL